MRIAFLLIMITVHSWDSCTSKAFGDDPEDVRSEPTQAAKRLVYDPLQLAINAATDATTHLTSLVGEGTFKRFVQDRADQEPKLWTEARVKVFFDTGKYHLHFNFQRMLRRTSCRDSESDAIEEKVVDFAPEDVYVVFDGTTAYSIRFSDRIHPTGCNGEILSDMRAAVGRADFQWVGVAQPWREALDLEKAVATLGRDAIKVEEQPQGVLRCEFRVRNSLKNRVAFELQQATGFRIADVVVNCDDAEVPIGSKHLEWAITDSVWHVNRIVENSDLREVNGGGTLRRSEFEYTSVTPNAKVDSQLFTIQGVPVPIGSRFIDRRRNATSRLQYAEGSSLLPRRPDIP